jgi:hypothetical protein
MANKMLEIMLMLREDGMDTLEQDSMWRAFLN